jgi:hypothetical protein
MRHRVVYLKWTTFDERNGDFLTGFWHHDEFHRSSVLRDYDWNVKSMVSSRPVARIHVWQNFRTRIIHRQL